MADKPPAASTAPDAKILRRLTLIRVYLPFDFVADACGWSLRICEPATLQGKTKNNALAFLSIKCQFMSMKRQAPNKVSWKPLESPGELGSPNPIIVRVQSLPARSQFVEHSHSWNQLVYAVTGVLTVSAEGRSMAISPEQAVWLPTGIKHSVGSLMGAEFRSLWVANDACPGIMPEVSVVEVSGLLRALIIEGATLNSVDDREYANRVVGLILDQLRRARATSAVLPWPRHPSLLAFCEALYADPADSRDADEWGRELGMSSRTLTRHFEQEVGMSLRACVCVFGFSRQSNFSVVTRLSLTSPLILVTRLLRPSSICFVRKWVTVRFNTGAD